MKITINNCLNCKTAHEWEYEQPTLREMRRIKARTGMNGAEYAACLGTGDPDATTAMIDLLHRRDGKELRWDDIDLDYDDFEIETTEEEAAAADEGKDEEAVAPQTPSGEPSEEG